MVKEIELLYTESYSILIRWDNIDKSFKFEANHITVDIRYLDTPDMSTYL